MGENTPVASDPTDVVIAAIDAWDRGDLRMLLELFTEDMEFRSSGTSPGLATVLRGREEYARWFEEWQSAWVEFSFTCLFAAALAGDRVVVANHQRGIGRGGIEVERTVFFLAHVRDGRIYRYESFLAERELFAAAQIDGWPQDAAANAVSNPDVFS